MITNWVRMRGPVRGTDWGHAGGMRAIHSAIDGIPSHHMMGQRSVKLVCLCEEIWEKPSIELRSCWATRETNIVWVVPE